MPKARATRASGKERAARIATPPRARETGRKFWQAGFLLLITIIAYSPVARNGFVWDDDDHITRNATLRSIDGLQRIWFEPGATVQYYPLTFTVWWVAYHLWGLHPLGYHLLNVVLHALAAILFLRVLERLEVPGALGAAAVFALHPVHVMSVAWATEMKNTLSTSLALGSASAFLCAAEIGASPGARSPRWRPYAAALALFSLALFAKTAVGLLPAILLAILWWKKDRPSWRDIATIAPFALLAVGLGRLTASVEHLTGAIGPEFDLGFAERLVVSGRSFWFYLGKLLLPVQLTFIYPRWNVVDSAPWAYLPILAVVALLGSLAILRSRLGKGPLVASLHFYLGTSALILFLVLYMTRYSFVSDHWQYLGSLDAISLGGAAWAALWERADEKLAALRRPFGAAVLIVLGTLTWRQCHAYRDPETLWRDTLSRNPAAWIAHVNLGTLLAGRGSLDEALSHYVAALESDPFHSDPRVARGAELLRRGRADAGIAEVRAAAVDLPFGHEALDGIGVVLASRKRIEEALDFFEASVRANPRYASGQFNRGMALRRLGRPREAAGALREATRLDPGRKDAHYELAAALHATGADADALREILEFQRLGGRPSADLVREIQEKAARRID